MKKKIIISLIIVTVLVLTVLFFPVYQGSYNDGGTREYQALTYKLVVWNKLIVEVDPDGQANNGLYEEVSIFWYPDNQKSIDELWQIERTKAGLDISQDARPTKSTQTETDYFIPDYDTTNNLHCDEFLEILKSDGYVRDGEKDYNYNTDNVTGIVNITPKSISDVTPDVEIFYVNTHCFLMVNQTIYRYDTSGGYHHQLCLWDYDGNGTKDLVSYHTWGSGLSYLSVSVFDLTSMKNINVISRMTLSEPAFSFEYKNDVIYIDGAELTYSDGNFHCSAFATFIPEFDGEASE